MSRSCTLFQPDAVGKDCLAGKREQRGFLGGVDLGALLLAVRCCVVQHGILRCTGGQADRHIGQRVGVCAIAQPVRAITLSSACSGAIMPSGEAAKRASNTVTTSVSKALL